MLPGAGCTRDKASFLVLNNHRTLRGEIEGSSYSATPWATQFPHVETPQHVEANRLKLLSLTDGQAFDVSVGS